MVMVSSWYVREETHAPTCCCGGLGGEDLLCLFFSLSTIHFHLIGSSLSFLFDNVLQGKKDAHHVPFVEYFVKSVHNYMFTTNTVLEGNNKKTHFRDILSSTLSKIGKMAALENQITNIVSLFSSLGWYCIWQLVQRGGGSIDLTARSQMDYSREKKTYIMARFFY